MSRQLIYWQYFGALLFNAALFMMKKEMKAVYKKIKRQIAGYGFMVAVITNTLVFLVSEVVIIMAGVDVINTYHALLTKTKTY